MKKLYVVRHAKSSWDYPNLSDKERPLNKRGERDAPNMAAYLAKRTATPETLISSTSVRTNRTADHFLKAFRMSREVLVQEELLFHASAHGFYQVVSQISERYGSAMLFGHNPGITSFVNDLCGESIDNIPTCGVAGIMLGIDSWGKIRGAKGDLEFYYYPKGI